MASHSSANNLWKITALSFSPSIITLGQTVQMTATYKNVSGGSMSHFANYAYIIPRFKTADGGQYVLPGIEIPFPLKYGTFLDSSLPNNGALTVTQTLDFTLPEDAPALDLTSRCLQPFVVHPASYDYPDGTILGLCVEITGQKNGGDFYTDRFYDISDNYGGDLVILSHNWSPAASLSVKRGLANGSASDEGERLLVTAKLSKNEYADTSAMFCRLYYEENGTATTSSSYIDLTPSISALLAGVTDDASLVTQTFSNGSNWSFLLVFGDDYETASAPASIALAFANVHMSGASTGGVAFGRFSSSSEGNPKFECAYPATFESDLDMRVGGIDVTDQFTISKTAGKLTISSFKAYKCGPMMFFQLNCSMSGTTSPGNSVFEGTISGPWLPSFTLCGMSGFWATSIEVFFVDTTGKVTLRAMVANDGPSGSSSWSGVRSFYYFF